MRRLRKRDANYSSSESGNRVAQHVYMYRQRRLELGWLDSLRPMRQALPECPSRARHGALESGVRCVRHAAKVSATCSKWALSYGECGTVQTIVQCATRGSCPSRSNGNAHKWNQSSTLASGNFYSLFTRPIDRVGADTCLETNPVTRDGAGGHEQRAKRHSRA